MAYMSPAHAKEIREELKKTFPAFKFGVRVDNHTALRVSIMRGPVRFSERDHEQLNHYYPERYQNADILKKMIEIINRKNWDKSDIMTDYFNVGFYLSLEQGKWDRPYVLVKEEK